jgi:hypothetical protein
VAQHGRSDGLGRDVGRAVVGGRADVDPSTAEFVVTSAATLTFDLLLAPPVTFRRNQASPFPA